MRYLSWRLVTHFTNATSPKTIPDAGMDEKHWKRRLWEQVQLDLLFLYIAIRDPAIMLLHSHYLHGWLYFLLPHFD